MHTTTLPDFLARAAAEIVARQKERDRRRALALTLAEWVKRHSKNPAHPRPTDAPACAPAQS